MDNIQNKDLKQNNSCFIYFPDTIFGKATKNRKEDPNMFEILTWDVDGFEKHSFKKNEKFHETSQAYLNMIGKNPWKSQSQQSFVNFNNHCIEANPDVLKKIDNYIEERVPQREKQRNKSLEKKENYQEEKAMLQKQQKLPQRIQNENQNQSLKNKKSYAQDQGSSRQMRRNSVDSTVKFNKKIKIQQNQKNASKLAKDVQTRPIHQKSYGQSNQKVKPQEYELTEGEQVKIIENFKQTTRWIPNSAFTTYFGKPPFENYGRANTKPTDGGLVYGSYLYSHNVHPHRGQNHPQNMQSYAVALMKAKSHGTLVPTHPRTKLDNSKQFQKSIGNTQCSNKIEPESNYFTGSLDIQVPRFSEMQKFGGNKKSKRSAVILT